MPIKLKITFRSQSQSQVQGATARLERVCLGTIGTTNI